MPTYRSLFETNHKILKDSQILETTLSARLAQGRAVKVLEVGFGRARALLELAWRFRNERAAFYGVDKKQEPPIQKRGDLAGIAREYAIAPEAELAGFVCPEIFFYDATRLHFDDDSLDLIYSVKTIRFIEDKAAFLEEVCRVLKPGGVALLQIGEANWEYPYSRICDEQLLTPCTNRFILKHGDELIPLNKYLRLFETGGLRFRFINRPRCVLQIDKRKPARLDLQLTLNSAFSLPMEELPHCHGSGKVRGGFRSVFDLRPEFYQALFAQRRLSREQLRTDIHLSDDLQKVMPHEQN